MGFSSALAAFRIDRQWRRRADGGMAFIPSQWFAATIPAMSNLSDKIDLQAALVVLVVGTIIAIAFGAMLTAVALHL
jgi:hypothetical protein